MKRNPVSILGAAALLAAGLLSSLASSAPDGLERVGEDLGFMAKATSLLASPLADYSWPGLPPLLAGPAAGVLGTVLTLIVATGAARLLRRREKGETGDRSLLD